MIPPAVKEKIQQIKADNSSGASILTHEAAETLKLLAKESVQLDEEKFTEVLYKTGGGLIKAQPTMAPIFSLVNAVLDEFKEFQGNTAFQEKKLPEICDKYIDNQKEAEDRMRKKAAGVIRNGHTIMTHSFSNSVLETMKEAFQAKRQFQVICTESRPANEGVTMAQELAKIGIKVELVTDAAVTLMINKVNSVFVGADAVNEHTFTNKTGTCQLALAAQATQAVFYVLCTSSKLLPIDAGLPRQPLKPASEILLNPPENITPVNYYYEHTPIRYCDGFITENGITKPAKLQQRFQKIPVDEHLKNLLTEST